MRSYAVTINEFINSRGIKGSISDFVLSEMYLGITDEDDRILVKPIMEYDELESKVFDIKAFKGPRHYEFEYGEYPQAVASITNNIQSALTSSYKAGNLQPTSKVYHILNDDGKITEVSEYFYEGKKYVPNIIKNNYKTKLSNDERYSCNELVWFEVQPVRWVLMDEIDKVWCENFIVQSADMMAIMNTNYVEKYFFSDITPSSLGKVRKR